MAESAPTCPQCDAVLTSRAQFCGNCGAHVTPPPLRSPSSEGATIDANAPTVDTSANPLGPNMPFGPRPGNTVLGLDSTAVRAALFAKQTPAATAQPSPVKAPLEIPVTPKNPARAAQKTMLGLTGDAPVRSGPSPAHISGALPRGVTPIPMAPAAQTPAQIAQANAAEPPTPSPRAGRGRLNQTMLGLSVPTSNAPPAPQPTAAGVPNAERGPLLGAFSQDAAPVAAPPNKRRSEQGTLLGITAAPSISPGPAALANTRVEGGALPAQGLPRSAAGPLNVTRREGDGFGADPAEIAQVPFAPLGKGHGRTMLGVPIAAMSPLPPGPGAASAQPFAPASPPREPQPAAASDADAPGAWASEPDPSSALATSPPSGPAAAALRARWPLIGLGLLLLGLSILLYVRTGAKPADSGVTARIVTSEAGESLLFEVANAPEGSKLRFVDQTQPLIAGRTTFALASDSLRVGDNTVQAEVLRPNGETTSTRINLVVSYRIRVDTSALSAKPPHLDLIVTAQSGTTVTLEGEALALDGQGRGTRQFPIDVVKDARSGVLDHVVHFRVQPPAGETVVDEIHTQIPVAMMQIDRPGRDGVTTDRDSIEIAGAVGRDTHVTIDGVAVPVKEGRFLQTFALPKPGEYQPRLVAEAANKASLELTLSIRRVKDLAQAAREEFVPNANLTYAKIASNPTSYRGQLIALEGRVYAFDAHAGSSVIQMLVRPCPSSQRCSLWVVDNQAGEVTVDRWIRVLGEVDGEQQFRSEKNEIVTVPKIKARFILPARP